MWGNNRYGKKQKRKQSSLTWRPLSCAIAATHDTTHQSTVALTRNNIRAAQKTCDNGNDNTTIAIKTTHRNCQLSTGAADERIPRTPTRPPPNRREFCNSPGHILTKKVHRITDQSFDPRYAEKNDHAPSTSSSLASSSFVSVPSVVLDHVSYLNDVLSFLVLLARFKRMLLPNTRTNWLVSYNNFNNLDITWNNRIRSKRS